MSAPHLVHGPVFQPGRGISKLRPFLASCSCGEFVRSERHEVCAQWADAHRAEHGAVDLGGDAA